MKTLTAGMPVKHISKWWTGTLVRFIPPGMWVVRTPDGRLVQWQRRVIVPNEKGG